ncbi:hypothetical protein ACFYS8_13530 [Kitasatospora sp. NPDC004615]|uniref:hypothetical protein n=1 Tax=unclassified Kitasatospora TaxID=2633591 RepID=UPI0036861CC0
MSGIASCGLARPMARAIRVMVRTSVVTGGVTSNVATRPLRDASIHARDAIAGSRLVGSGTQAWAGPVASALMVDSHMRGADDGVEVAHHSIAVPGQGEDAVGVERGLIGAAGDAGLSMEASKADALIGQGIFCRAISSIEHRDDRHGQASGTRRYKKWHLIRFDRNPARSDTT